MGKKKEVSCRNTPSWGKQTVYVGSEVTFISVLTTGLASWVSSLGSGLQFVCLKDYNPSKSNRHLEHNPALPINTCQMVWVHSAEHTYIREEGERPGKGHHTHVWHQHMMSWLPIYRNLNWLHIIILQL